MKLLLLWTDYYIIIMNDYMLLYIYMNVCADAITFITRNILLYIFNKHWSNFPKMTPMSTLHNLGTLKLGRATFQVPSSI
jgi:hypothetical protein